MAEFCWQCTEEYLFPDGSRNDFIGIVPEGATLRVLCEGCGFIEVDHEGRRVGEPDPEA